jgi:hypothetical protein
MPSTDSPMRLPTWFPVHWLAGLTTLAYTLSRFVPCSPPGHSPVYTLDESWVQTLHFAFAQHLQFGRDIVFPFGPWGFLCGGYYPPTFMVSTVVWITLAFVFWWCLWQMARHFWKSEFVAWLWMIGCIGVTGLPVDQGFDVRLDAWVLIFLFLHFFVNNAAFSTMKILLVISLALLGLTKFTGLLMAGGIVLIVAADDVLRRRRFPWLLVVFGLSVFFFWLAAGQRLSSFGPFLCNSWQVAGGYTEGMMCGGQTELRDALVFWLAAAAACAPAGLAAFVKYRRFGAGPLIGLGFVLFLGFKHGYVRHDQHESEAVLMVLLVGLTGLAAAWPVLRSRNRRAILMGWLLGITILTYAALSFSRCVPGKGMFARFAGTLAPRVVLSPAKLFYNANDLQSAYKNRLAEIRDEFPLPELDGSVDAYPWDQVVIFAHGWRYAPRPVIQSYSAYTPALAEMNAVHLRSERAPDNLVFTLRTLDRRYPSLDDGCSWLDILTRYDVRGATKDFVLLKKSTTPGEYHLVPLKDSLIHFAEPVALPATTNGPVWAELEVNKTPLGSFITALYKPPTLALAVFLQDGQRLYFRLVPGMARSGFLLSPLINDNTSFVALATHDWRSLTDAAVTSITVYALTRSGTTVCYQSPMRLRLYRLEYPRPSTKTGMPHPVESPTASMSDPSRRP